MKGPIFRRRRPPVGSRPGTLVVAEDAPPPVIRVIVFSPEGVEEHADVRAGNVRDYLREGWTCWVDVTGLGDADVLHQLASAFSLHPLVTSDVVNVPQRPKTEDYEDQQLIVTRMIQLGAPGSVGIEQVSLILGRGFLLTFQEREGDVLDPVRTRIREGKGPIRRAGPDYLAYAIVDAVVDAYYPVLETLGDYLEELEDLTLTAASPETLRKLTEVKSTLLLVRRSVWPQREALNSLVRDESPLITEATRVYLRDTYDHCVQMAEVIESYRELASGLMNTYLSVVSNRMNEIMKVLTIMASIFIPLTFLAGIYGMNFEFMPELHVRWAYPSLLVLMGVSVVGMIVYFWRKGWIGSSACKPKDDS
jgi:magnesium transporter